MLTAVPAAWWLAGPAAGPAPGSGPVPVPVETTAAAAAPAVAPGSGDPADTGDPAAPIRIRLLDLDVDVPVVPVGVDDRGEMQVPEDVRTVGWYRFGPGPGAAGSSVLSGHVDDRVQGRGAFYRLTELAEGGRVQVDLADGTQLGYRVRAVERIDKSTLPVDRLFARDGAPRLTLVTCGGDFDRAAGRYRDNVVVTAEPEDGRR